MMTEQDFDAEYREISRRGTRAEQDLARLFDRSGWTKEKIAERTGESRGRVSQKVVFGRFLNSVTGCNAHDLSALTEGRFRALYTQTRGQEAERFAEVLRLVEGAAPTQEKAVQKGAVKAAVVDGLSDGAWHTLKDLKAHVRSRVPGAREHTVTTMAARVHQKPPEGHVAEIKRVGRVVQYRLRPLGRAADVTPEQVLHILDGIGPIITELKQWGRAHECQMSPVAIRRIASQLEKLFSPLTQEVDA